MATSTIIVFDSPDAQMRLVYDDAVWEEGVNPWDRNFKVLSVGVTSRGVRPVRMQAEMRQGTVVSRTFTGSAVVNVAFIGTQFMNCSNWSVSFT